VAAAFYLLIILEREEKKKSKEETGMDRHLPRLYFSLLKGGGTERKSRTLFPSPFRGKILVEGGKKKEGWKHRHSLSYSLP